MLSVKNLLFLAVAVTGSVIKRDAALIKADLATINTHTLALTTAVNNYNGGGVINALPIINAQNQLTTDINKATDDAIATGSVGTTDAQDIINYITLTLEPNIKASLTALKGKKPHFVTDGLTSLVKTSLQNLKTDTDELGAALIAGTPAPLVPQAQAIQAVIDADFNDAITFFT